MQKIPKILVIIFLFALLIRIFRLNTFPLGFHIDEAKVAWESLSILKTTRDDHGNLLALYYNSFGDYRPTGIFYLTLPFVALAKTNFMVRLPSSLIGALTIFPLFYLSLYITKNKKIAYFSSILLSIVPWHITTSRATSEVVISCFLILSSLVLLSKKPIVSFFLLALSFLFYHSARVVGPGLMFIWITYIFTQNEKLDFKKIFIGFYLTTFISLCLLLSPTGLARYNQVKLPSPNLHNLITNYTSYFDPNFFIGDISKPFRYRVNNVGIVSLPIFLCFLLGIYVLLKSTKSTILLIFFLLGPIPASLTLEDSPNLHRAFFMLPFFIIIAAIGLNFLFENYKFFYRLTIFAIFISFLIFTKNYFSTDDNFAYEYRNPQTKSLSDYIYQNKNNYSKVFVTNDPDSPYPWFYFFNNYNPQEVNKALQKGSNGKWQYENIIWDNTKCPAGAAFAQAKADKFLQKIMVVDNGACFTDFERQHPEAQIIREFIYNGKVNYRVWSYQPTRI